MSVEHTSVVAAVWFLGGLGLHQGDGAKGSELRSILRCLASTEVEAVEKRVAMLGLLLAGKWLDDNSFLNKSWTEVTSIPVVDIHQMEVAALQDLHWALYVPPPPGPMVVKLDLEDPKDWFEFATLAICDPAQTQWCKSFQVWFSGTEGLDEEEVTDGESEDSSSNLGYNSQAETE